MAISEYTLLSPNEVGPYLLEQIKQTYTYLAVTNPDEPNFPLFLLSVPTFTPTGYSFATPGYAEFVQFIADRYMQDQSKLHGCFVELTHGQLVYASDVIGNSNSYNSPWYVEHVLDGHILSNLELAHAMENGVSLIDPTYISTDIEHDIED